MQTIKWRRIKEEKKKERREKERGGEGGRERERSILLRNFLTDEIYISKKMEKRESTIFTYLIR